MFVEQRLPLCNHTLFFVIQNDNLNWSTGLNSRGHFHQSHVERSITIDIDDNSVWLGDLGTNGGWALDGMVDLIGMACLKMEAVTSFGKSTKTGPGLPEVAISKASLIRLGNSATSLTITFHLVQDLEIPTTSASWKASVPMADVAT
ncbi:hypothetical protein WICPIJ_001503 [Wickerhamomyces pijperi]|uniref:Uncharacterized protein n=1 Tax=Wickerhamomyces pijperi TaxID=599730 RepID=A0A9P8QDG9_WICPI|nr:hypothetical protein WICPIJ_001503 [Wickerhamomyces pijperi]